MTWFHWILVGWLVCIGYVCWEMRRAPVVSDDYECFPEVVIVSDSGEVYPVTDEWPQQELLQVVEEIEAL